MNLIIAGSSPTVGIAPGFTLDFGLLNTGVLVPYLGLKFQTIFIGSDFSAGWMIELQPRFGVEMFLFLQKKMSLYVEVGVPITFPVRGGGVVVEFGNLAFGFRYYV